MEKKVKRLMKMVRVGLGKEMYCKVKKIKDRKDLEETLKYLLIRYLEREHYIIEKQIKKLEESSFDMFFVRNKALMLPAKIEYLKADFDEVEFDKLRGLIGELKEEIKNA